MKKTISAYCIAFEGNLCIDYLRKTKQQAIRTLICDDSDRMGWTYEKRQNKATCVKVIITRAPDSKKL